ncbi:conserved hypothetical protein [Uncinocarpus reesii 1704]|uniref:Band 7 domain-containing protein n=1 Tax=Uncinocarpus reesii (strain UAMH 1704) TaxID=336963 RepID=C4JYR8_UNCRE|nr:uncharacterized protein UREG_07319 [Uncinocarpus reesii 1704]EEP82454.1 conserved hypothetical protein [Uncinocarpus reesii 1704]
MDADSATVDSQSHGKAAVRDQPPDVFKSNNRPGGGEIISVQPARLEDLQPSYAQILNHPTQSTDGHGWYSAIIHGLGELIGCLGAIPCCIVCPNPFRPVDQGQVGLVTKFGRFERAVDPGLVKVNVLSEKLKTIDVKIQIVEVPRQVCMTKDNVTLHLTSVIYYHVVSPHKVACGVAMFARHSSNEHRRHCDKVVVPRVLQDVIEQRLSTMCRPPWGVKVESMLIKDLIFSDELQESLSMAAQSKRIGESKVIAARAEVEAAKLMRAAADILSSAPAMQIRYLETMQQMAKSSNSKVIFLPAPNQTMSQLQDSLNQADNAGEGPSRHSNPFDVDTNDGFQQAMNARVIENI